MPTSKCLSRLPTWAALALLLAAGAVQAQERMPNADAPYTEAGADTCIKCHDQDSKVPVFPIFKTKHARKADERTPFAHLQCESCHGPGGEHGKRIRRRETRPPILNFGAKANASAEVQNEQCVGCHNESARLAWPGSEHHRGDVACADCHTIHTASDPVLEQQDQAEVCYRCHKKERTDFLKPSAHPVRHGQLACSGCHEAHGSTTEGLLAAQSMNQTCYRCHAEKRGPFLWEHAAAAEDCGTCHEPHGSVHPGLLTKRAPLLCQECHSQAGHPSLAYTPAGLPGRNPSALLLSRSCLNCHSQVHGSNHPSGVKLMR